MSRLKALYRSWGIACAGRDVYYVRHRTQWLREGWGYEQPHRFLIFDRDATFSADVISTDK